MLDQNGKDHMQNSKNTGSELSFYWQHYGLSQDPFPAINDPSSYFPLPQWEHHLDLLQHLIKSENVLLAAIGGEGSGKTTFATQIQQTFNDNYLVHNFGADSLFSTRKLVRELEVGFDLKARVNESPEEQLDAQIAEVQHKQQPCLLIIDDAHFLPLETINSLLFLLKQQSQNQMRLHIILFGDKNLQAKLMNLAKHELSGELIHSIDISPLTLEETKQYLLYRLNRAGLDGPMPLSQMNIERIYANSEGVPDRINQMAQQILLDELSKQKQTSGPSVFKRHQTKIIGGCLLVVALVVASYTLEKQGEYSSPKPNQAVISFAKQNQTMEVPSQSQSPALQQKIVTASKSVQPLAPVSNSMDKVEHKTATTVAVIEPSIVPKAGIEAKKLAELTLDKAIEKARATRIKKQIAQKPAKPIRLAKLEQVSAIPAQQPYHVDIIKHPKLAKKFNTKVVGTSTATQSKSVQKRVLQKTEVKSSAKLKPLVNESKFAKKLQTKGLKLTKGEDSLLKENSRDYTLQVIGLSYEKSMLNFIHENHLQGNAHYVKTKLHGKPWFVLVYGIYQTRQQASAAIKNLPSALKKYQPWPRQLKYVKVDIDRG